MEDISTRGDDHIDQFHPDHIADHSAHPPWDHGSGETQKDDALRIIKHLSENFKAFKDIPALKRGVLEGLDQIEQGLNPIEIQMPDRFLKNF